MEHMMSLTGDRGAFFMRGKERLWDTERSALLSSAGTYCGQSCAVCSEDGGERMPRSPRRACAYPGCPRLAEDGCQYCAQHRKAERDRYNKYERSPDVNRKYGRAWQRIRNRYAAAHPLCEMCLKEGKLTPVEEVHHIKPISQGGDHRESNLMSLCQSCHTKLHHELGDR